MLNIIFTEGFIRIVLAAGTLLSDAVSILGSLDLVIPEVDR